MNPKELIAEVEALRAEKKGLLERERLLHRAFDQLTAERDEARAELAKAGESIRAYERMIDGVAEKASALACKEVEAEFLRRDTIARLQTAEIEALKNELARLTTPRPSEPLELDCGDNSCLFAKTRGGMRTNGGCQCLESLGFRGGRQRALGQMAAEVVSLRKRVSDLTTPRPIAEAPKDGTWVLACVAGASGRVRLSGCDCADGAGESRISDERVG